MTTDEEARLVIALSKELTERMKASPISYPIKITVLLKTAVAVWRDAQPNASNAALLKWLTIAIRALL